MRRELFSGLVLTAMMFAACSDDLGHSSKYDDGFLHFNLLFNNTAENRWNEDGNTGGTRCEAPIELTSTDLPDLKLYLHTEISDQIDLPAPVAEPGSSNGETRGQRYTGEVFPSITTLGIWGKVGSTPVLYKSGDDTSFKKFDLTSAVTGETWSEESGWQVKQDEQELAIEAWWPGQVGTFYGVAPYPGSGTGEAPCITATVSGTPTLTYTMPTAEDDHKDVLVAKTEVTKSGTNDDIELEFNHVLSAVRFRLANGDANGIYECNVKDAGGTIVTTYKIDIKQIEVKGIYKSGTYNIATGEWTYSATPGNIGNCTVTEADITNYTSGTATTPRYFNNDANCLMMLPQTTPTSGAEVVFTCDLYEGASLTPKKENITFAASLNNKEWASGHSYSYTLSDQKLLYYIETTCETSTLGTSSTYFPLMGSDNTDATKKTLTVKSYYYDENNSDENGIAADWIPQYSTDGVTWTDGLPDGFYLEDENGDALDDDEMENGIKGSVSAKTYKLCAMFRSENSPSVQPLRHKRYKPGHNQVNSTTVLSNTAVPVTYDANGYYDLSYQLDASNRNTANCYIVDGYGKFKFPLVYGNAITHGNTFDKAYTIYPNTYSLEQTESGYAWREYTDVRTFVNYKGDQISSPYIWTDTGVDPQDISAYIVWQDSKDMILHDYEKVFVSKENDNLWYMHFEIAKNKVTSGNAILALKDGNGDIMWSWHIWVTPLVFSNTVNVYDASSHSFDFARWNLGRRNAEETAYPDEKIEHIRAKQVASNIIGKDRTTSAPADYTVIQDKGTVSLGGSNLYFQNGRKDPMPAQYAIKGTGYTCIGVDMANEFKAFYDSSDPRHYDWSVVELTNVNKIQVETTILNPDKLYPAGAGDFIRSEQYNSENVYEGRRNGGRWDPQKAYATSCKSAYAHVKTVHDPSPAGYTVPPFAAYDVLLEWAYNSGNNQGGTRDAGNLRGKILKHSSADPDEDGLYFYASGERHQGAGRVVDWNSQGRFWTAGIGPTNAHHYGDGHFLNLNVGGGATPTATTNTDNYCRNHSYGVRSVKETVWDWQP